MPIRHHLVKQQPSRKQQPGRRLLARRLLRQKPKEQPNQTIMHARTHDSRLLQRKEEIAVPKQKQLPVPQIHQRQNPKDLQFLQKQNAPQKNTSKLSNAKIEDF